MAKTHPSRLPPPGALRQWLKGSGISTPDHPPYPKSPAPARHNAPLSREANPGARQREQWATEQGWSSFNEYGDAAVAHEEARKGRK